MAKLVCLVALLLVASAMVAEAHAPAPAPAPSHSHIEKHAFFYLKSIIHNLAEKAVTFKLVIHDKPAAKPVVAKAKEWTAIGPVKVECKVPVVVLCVTVKNHKGEAVTKSFPVKLAEFLKDIRPKSSKFFVVTVIEKSHPHFKELVFKINYKEVLVLKC